MYGIPGKKEESELISKKCTKLVQNIGWEHTSHILVSETTCGWVFKFDAVTTQKYSYTDDKTIKIKNIANQYHKSFLTMTLIPTFKMSSLLFLYMYCS